ncbi:hypothetical protein J5N97_026481 [Dioscorea zingiberensis]|uniref:Pierisin-like domain-containing protein n=1 Tax=Dioscorea zingiberensis TaxID=325984 RepID=A0A9D5H6Q7_9LILI|nr:hypothetical protein J5N97_026481 [Dioscorea zingiberensis]
MSISADSKWRGCATKFSQPVSEKEKHTAQALIDNIYYYNCRHAAPCLRDVIYRSSYGDSDIVRSTFYWDLTPYEQIFQKGIQVIRQENIPDKIYYNLNHIHDHARNLNCTVPAPHVFVRATIDGSWNPKLEPNIKVRVYRYEIYAPGGIWAAQSLGQCCKTHEQDEVCFVAGIAPQYIRCAQRFTLISDARYTRRVRPNKKIIVNSLFNPSSHPPRLLNIQRPIFDCIDTGNNRRVPLIINIDTTTARRGAIKWYAKDVADFKSYIDAAFRSSSKNQAYLFMKNEYVLLDYAPGSKDDRVLIGPRLIGDGFPSLRGTAFAAHGIDCAFGSHEWNESFIFSGNLCAKLNYTPRTTNDRIIRGPMTIAEMFPFFKGTEFENGIDAAFESSRKNEAFLFKGSQYALINYGYDFHLIAIRRIIDGFFCFRGTIFDSGFDAAFASHRYEEAYIFKGKFYALLKFAPGRTSDYIIGGVKEILPNWPSLYGILPRKNHGLDVSSCDEC